MSIAFSACQSVAPRVGRYVVTATPLDVNVADGLCIAVDPADPKGIWWWQPVNGDCARRSTGPDVFPAGNAQVDASNRATGVHARFRVDLITGPGGKSPAFRDISLLLANEEISSAATGARVKTIRRDDLKIPER